MTETGNKTKEKAEKPNINDFLHWLKLFAEKNTYFKQVLLFGSFAKNFQGVNSDIDIAIALHTPDQWHTCRSAIENNPITLRAIDIVNLDNCSAPLRNQILKEGIIIYERK